MNMTTNANMNEAFEMMNKAANDGYANLRALAELNMSTWDKLVAKQMEMMNMCVDASTKQMEGAKDVKAPQELMTKQVEMARECGEKVLEKNREMLELFNEVRDEYKGWAEASVSQLKEQFGQAEKVVRKTTRKAA
jgi:phasin family protein